MDGLLLLKIHFMKKNIGYFLLLLLLLCIKMTSLKAQPSVVRRWNNAMLQAIREDLARPPVQARNLFQVSMAMWDAWAAYDTLTADTYLLGKTVGTYTCQFDGVPTPPDIRAAREKAISYAAYRILVRRYQNSPNAPASIQRICCPAKQKEKGEIEFLYTLEAGVCKVSSVDELLRNNGLLVT